jgi:MinD-like ATPase involved in chromosome partitioning or flagellar assembly
MTKIVSVHSFRGGTGKSNITANLAAALAAGGSRIAVVDTDIQSPGIHALFNLDASKVQHSLNDYLWGRCPIEDTAYDVSAVLRSAGVNQGQIFLVASSLRLGEIARILRDGYDVDMLNDGLQDLIERLQLDYLLIDTHPGINEETLLSLTISDMLLIILRPDRQDFQGTAVTVEVARRLQVPNLLLVVNRVLPVYDAEAWRNR